MANASSYRIDQKVINNHRSHHSRIILDLGGGQITTASDLGTGMNPGPIRAIHNMPVPKANFLMVGGNDPIGLLLHRHRNRCSLPLERLRTPVHPFSIFRSRNMSEPLRFGRQEFPKAIKRVYIRILLFYIGGTLIIGLLVPFNDED